MSTGGERIFASTLDNGLGLRLLARPHLRTVSMGLFVRQGSRFERKEDSGISHFIEHLLWNPRHMPAGARELLYRLVDRGARYEAFTSKEYTRFMVTCLPDEMELAIEIMGAILCAPEVREESVEHERSVILHEHAMSFTSTRIILGEVLDNSVWGDRSLGLFVIGRRENIQRFRRDEIARRLARGYTPERSCLAVVGPVARRRLLAAVGEHLAAWGRGEEAGDEPVPPPDPRRLSIPQRSTRVDLLLGFPGPGHGSRERWALELLGDVLGAGWKSRLFLALRERRKLAYLVRAFTSAYRGGAYLGVQVNCEAGDVAEVLAVVEEELAALRRDGVGREEVERAVAGKRIVLCEALDQSGSVLQMIGRRALYGEEFDPGREMEGYARVTPEEMTGLARQVLDFDNAGIVARGLDSEELERLCAPAGAGTLATAAGGGDGGH